MNKSFILLFFCFIYYTAYAQTASRISLTAVTPSENTGQDYSSWLNDNLSTLVPNVWNSANLKYTDVTLTLTSRSKVSSLSLYDYEGVFTDYPASLYALNGTQKTLIGTFTGVQYKVFVNLTPAVPLIADAIVIHKYSNGIPEKIQVYGTPYVDSSSTGVADSLPKAVITFNDLANKSVTDSAFNLIATSSNTLTSVTFASNNPSVLSVALVGKNWVASPVSAGVATITASQVAGGNYSFAMDVSKSITINATGAILSSNVKIPIDPKRWFQLTNATNGLDGLFDGDTQTDVHTGWGKILSQYDSYYPVLTGEQIDLSAIRLYDGNGSTTTQQMTLSVITSDGQKITFATFNGNQYKMWVGPDPNNPTQYNLPAVFKNIKYIVMNSWDFFPTEIEFYGNYKAGATVTATVNKSYPLKQYFGVNGFEWNFEAPTNPSIIDPFYLKAAKTFSGFRHYMDWQKLESSERSYTYNPTSNGGWNYDDLYDSCRTAGIEIMACLKTLPTYMLATFPSGIQDADNVPLRYGSSFTDPASYIDQAKVAFQYTARYGSNTAVDRSLLSVNNVSRWTGDIVNTVKVGLGLVHYIECDNERDKWWKGRIAYQTAYEYAANLSAFYDGNKNTMGPGVGVKNADSTMKIVMGGTALATTDYVKGMVDWCRVHRGYNTDGSVNLCWDVINYHLYATNAQSSQNSTATRGAAPEVTGTAAVAATFIDAAHKYAGDMPVWVTELGYDINQGSSYKAIPIGNKTALQTQADWILRSSLLYARSGIAKIFFYEMYDDNSASSSQFSTCGLINQDKTRKPAGDFIYQTKSLFGNYIFQNTLNSDPFVDRYSFNNTNIYAIVIPDETGRTANYSLDLGNAAYAKIYTPTIGSDTMTWKIVPTNQGKLNVLATETPVFIMPVVNIFGRISNGAITTEPLRNKLDNLINVFPNPSKDNINIIVNTISSELVNLKIIEAGSGKIFKKISFNKPSGYFSKTIDIMSLPTGYYFIEIEQGENKFTKKLLKKG